MHEEIVDPELLIIDSHHHLRDRPNDSYFFDDLRHDLEAGHAIAATVVVECGTMYRAEGPEALRPLGETEFFVGVAAMFASGAYGPTGVCSAIVAYADLRLGDAVLPVLEAQAAAAGGRLRGIRNPVTFHPDPTLMQGRRSPAGHLMDDMSFRRGVARLAPLGLSLDLWLYHTQLDELVSLATAFSDLVIVVNHVGGPIGIGPFEGRRDEVFHDWRRGMTAAAACPNVMVKLGGLGMPVMGFGLAEREERPSAADLAQMWRPYLETAIDLFGPDRCMFESNYPSDREAGSFRTIWNALKSVAQHYSDDEKAALFSGTSARVYRVRQCTPPLTG